MRESVERERGYRKLLPVVDTLQCGVVARDATRTITFVNERLLGWLGYSRHEVEGRPAENLFPSELHESVRREIAAADEGDLRIRRTAMRRSDSTTFPVFILPGPRSTPSGEADGAVSLVVDAGAIETAKPVGSGRAQGFGATLARISLELQGMSLLADLPWSSAVPLHHPALRDLSPREQEILVGLVAGDRVPALAKRLHISPHPVRNHLKSIYGKVGVGTQSELIQLVRSLRTSPDGA